MKKCKCPRINKYHNTTHTLPLPTDTVAAVLDWELSTLGDRLSDLAYLSMAYHLDPNNPFLKGVKGERDLSSCIVL